MCHLSCQTTGDKTGLTSFMAVLKMSVKRNTEKAGNPVFNKVTNP